MRITPHDIRQQQFTSKIFKGYDPHEVDAFLDDVAEDYESVLKETALLREQMAAIEERARSELGMIGRNETFYQVVPVRPRTSLPTKAVEHTQTAAR